MEKYKEKPIHWLWYIVLLLFICIFLLGYIKVTFAFFICYFFVGRILMYLDNRYKANIMINTLSYALQKSIDIRDLEKLISAIIIKKVHLRIYLLNMIERKASTIGVEAVYPKTI